MALVIDHDRQTIKRRSCLRIMWEDAPKWQTFAIGATCLLAGMLMLGPALGVLFAPKPAAPVVILQSKIVSDVIYPGEPLVFHLETKTSDRAPCIGSVTREFFDFFRNPDGTFLLSKSGKKIRNKWREAGPPPIARADETEYFVSVHLPVDLPFGEDWNFTGESTYACGDTILQYRTTDMSFKYRPNPK